MSRAAPLGSSWSRPRLQPQLTMAINAACAAGISTSTAMDSSTVVDPMVPGVIELGTSDDRAMAGWPAAGSACRARASGAACRAGVAAATAVDLLPGPGGAAAAAQVLAGAQDVTLDRRRAAPGRLADPAPPGTPDRQLAVVVAPGNAGNRLARAPLAAALAGRAHRAAGRLPRLWRQPRPPEGGGLARDVAGGPVLPRDQAGFPADRLLFYGESLGAAVVTALAARHPRPAWSCGLPSPIWRRPARRTIRSCRYGAARDRFPVAT